MRPLLLKFFAVIAFFLVCAAALTQAFCQSQTGKSSQSTQAVVPRSRLAAQRGANEKVQLPGDGNLPEAASALPLLSVIGAGALLGGLLSARRTRREK